MDAPFLAVETSDAGGAETVWQGKGLDEVQMEKRGDRKKDIPPQRRTGHKRRCDPGTFETRGQPDVGVTCLKRTDGESL